MMAMIMIPFIGSAFRDADMFNAGIFKVLHLISESDSRAAATELHSLR